jgi:hypothetical protein
VVPEEKDQPEGAVTVNADTAYWFEAGLKMDSVAVGVVADATTFGVMVKTTGEVLVPNAGVASGTRTRSPENARSARIVPELNFVTYALLCVYIVYFRTNNPWDRI